MNIPIPNNEAERLAALKEYRVLDTSSEQPYDDITTMAAHICQVPMATISLVDEARQWFKARVGVTRRQTPREIAFCSYTILKREPLVIRDAKKDQRFAKNEMVTGEPHIRFYAGFPLVNQQGLAVGTLCAMDRKPRELTAKQEKAMRALVRQIMTLLELRRVSVHLADALNQIKTLQGLLPICAWCKRVRDDEGYWDQVEAYLHKHTGVDFTHGICPECLEKMRPRESSNVEQPQPRHG